MTCEDINYIFILIKIKYQILLHLQFLDNLNKKLFRDSAVTKLYDLSFLTISDSILMNCPLTHLHGGVVCIVLILSQLPNPLAHICAILLQGCNKRNYKLAQWLFFSMPISFPANSHHKVPEHLQYKVSSGTHVVQSSGTLAAHRYGTFAVQSSAIPVTQVLEHL